MFWAEDAHAERKTAHGLTRYAHSRDRSGTIAALEDQAKAALVTLRHKIAAQGNFGRQAAQMGAVMVQQAHARQQAAAAQQRTIDELGVFGSSSVDMSMPSFVAEENRRSFNAGVVTAPGQVGPLGHRPIRRRPSL